jgi:hypothetical protein
MTANYSGILALEIIGFFTSVIYNEKLPQWSYNIGPWWHLGGRTMQNLQNFHDDILVKFTNL